MKKAAPAKNALKMSSTNQIILASILVLLIFLAAMLSSPQKKGVPQPATTQETMSSDGSRTGTQVARISITREGENLPGTTMGATGFVQYAENTKATSGIANIQPGSSVAGTANADAATAPTEPKNESVIAAGERVKFKIDKFQKLALQPLKFKLFDSAGRELTPDYLQTVREHKVHFTVVSANLREFQHLFPEYVNGQWNVNANLPNPGTYYAYTDISPIKGTREVLRSELTVREPTKGAISYPGLTPNALAMTGGASALLGLRGIGLGAENILGYSLTRDGKNLDIVKPFTGAFGYVTLFRQGDTGVYLVARSLPVTDEGKGMFDFAANFTKAGTYTAFAEFKADGKVLVFPITFNMP